MTESFPRGLQSALIVTSSERTRRVYAEYLASRNIEVRDVETAAAAVRDLALGLPDVLVTEDRLPDSTGQELVRTLRRTRYTFTLPVVLICSDTFAARTADESHRYGCDCMLRAPLLPEALHDALQATVAECAMRRATRPFEAWLFVRDAESVWMVRTAELELAVAGPGRGRGVYTFGDEHELQSFQAEYERRLRRTGFALETAGGDRRSGHDRRQTPRPGVQDRRVVQ